MRGWKRDEVETSTARESCEPLCGEEKTQKKKNRGGRVAREPTFSRWKAGDRMPSPRPEPTWLCRMPHAAVVASGEHAAVAAAGRGDRELDLEREEDDSNEGGHSATQNSQGWGPLENGAVNGG